MQDAFFRGQATELSSVYDGSRRSRPTLYPYEYGTPCGLGPLQRVKSRTCQPEGGLSMEIQELLVEALLCSLPCNPSREMIRAAV